MDSCRREKLRMMAERKNKQHFSVNKIIKLTADLLIVLNESVMKTQLRKASHSTVEAHCH